MTHILAKTLAAAAIGAMTLAPLAPARADSAGPAIAAGIGGLAVGAMLGGALSQPSPPPAYYAPPRPRRVYVEEPVYYAPRPHCWMERRPLFNEFGDVEGYQPRRVCD